MNGWVWFTNQHKQDLHLKFSLLKSQKKITIRIFKDNGEEIQSYVRLSKQVTTEDWNENIDNL